MYRAVTRGIEVTASPRYLEDESDPAAGRWLFAYTIEIVNRGAVTVQLRSRRWRITDGLGHVQLVEGPGVVGEQPVLRPGERFRYTSGCPLTTPQGTMEGAYRMVDEAGASFEVEIPAFSLDSPHVRRILN
jgi:ApaG protein